MPELRKCKECGKLFQPKGREQYCPEIHYRPCPSCGEPVIAKYLSDPPRRCDKCKGRKSIDIKPKPEIKQQTKEQSEVQTKEKQTKPKQKSLFNLNTMKADVPKLNTVQPMKTVTPIAPKKEEEKQQPKPTTKIQRTTPAPATIDKAIFCENMTGTIVKYIGNPHKNQFIPGHNYLIRVEHKDYVYWVTSTEDMTDNDTVDIMLPYASQISFHQNFEIA